jgi:quinol monooxygenase YgiN
MITIFFSMTVKADRQTEFEILARDMTTSTKAQDQGCLAYTFYRRADQQHHRRRLPKAFLALLEKTDAVRYEALE